ncbi:MAG: ATP-binding protein [Suipraeoptans sp.]
MIIRELYIKNFGKFKEKKFAFDDNLNLIYGENEAGKSTIHGFIKSMLFGMERGRGKAAISDDFSKYEPWENSNYYSGSITFSIGDRNFVLTRNFDKYGKSAELICTDDGEVLDVEGGDLEILLGGITKEIYENTVSISQMSIETNVELVEAFNNYAASYFMTGESDIDFQTAIDILSEQKKQESKEIKSALEKRQKKKETIENEMTYVWRDVHRLEEELESLEESLKNRRKEQNVKQETTYSTGYRVHPVEILLFLLSTILSFVLIPRPWNTLVTVMVFLLSIIYTWNRIKVSKNQVKTESERILEQMAKQKGILPLEQLTWNKKRVEEELRDKKLLYYNLKEQLQDFDEMSDLLQRQEQKKASIEMAIETLGSISKDMRSILDKRLIGEMSQILSTITSGKYDRLYFNDELNCYVISGGRQVSLFNLSRGTVEQIYFSLRLAISRIVLKESIPLVFDDTFVYYDENRLKEVICFLPSLNKQVFLFTCHERESEILRENHIEFSEVKI